MPNRIQRKRTKDWRMPENAVYVGRPTKYGNPYRPNVRMPAANGQGWYTLSPEKCLEAFRLYAEWMVEENPRVLDPLRGKDLACWCPLSQPCHADVLLRLANNGGVHD